MNLHPDVATLGQAFLDLITQYGWDSITILYQNNYSMARLKQIFDKTSDAAPNTIRYPRHFFQSLDGSQSLIFNRFLAKELVYNEENGYRDVLKEVYMSKANIIVLDCEKELIGEVLKQAQQVGLISEGYYFLITSLDTHTVDMENFKYGGTNFSTFRSIYTFLDAPSRKLILSCTPSDWSIQTRWKFRV